MIYYVDMWCVIRASHEEITMMGQTSDSFKAGDRVRVKKGAYPELPGWGHATGVVMPDSAQTQRPNIYVEFPSNAGYPNRPHINFPPGKLELVPSQVLPIQARPECGLKETPPLGVGDRVRVKGYSENWDGLVGTIVGTKYHFCPPPKWLHVDMANGFQTIFEARHLELIKEEDPLFSPVCLRAWECTFSYENIPIKGPNGDPAKTVSRDDVLVSLGRLLGMLRSDKECVKCLEKVVTYIKGPK